MKPAMSLGALLLAAAMSMPVAATSTDEARAMAMTQAACAAFRAGDTARVEQLLTSDFVLVGSDGSMQSRAEVIAELQSGEPAYEEFRNHSMSVRIHGDTAVVHGITTIRGRAGGQPFAVDVRFTDTLIRRDGSWRMLASHASRLPAD